MRRPVGWVYLASIVVAFLVGLLIGRRYPARHFVPVGNGDIAVETTTGRQCFTWSRSDFPNQDKDDGVVFCDDLK